MATDVIIWKDPCQDLIESRKLCQLLVCFTTGEEHTVKDVMARE